MPGHLPERDALLAICEHWQASALLGHALGLQQILVRLLERFRLHQISNYQLLLTDCSNISSALTTTASAEAVFPVPLTSSAIIWFPPLTVSISSSLRPLGNAVAVRRKDRFHAPRTRCTFPCFARKRQG